MWRWHVFQAGQAVKSGNWQRAEANFTKALSIVEEIVKGAGADVIVNAELCLAHTLAELGAVASHAGDKDKSDSLRQRASDLRIKHAGSNVEREINALVTKGRVLLKEEKVDEAVLLFSEARQLSESKYGLEDQRIIPSLDALASAMLSLKNFDQCERLHRRILALREQAPEPNELDIAMTLFSLSLILRLKKELDEAEQLLLRALAILERPEPSLGQTIKAVATAKGDLKKIEKVQDLSYGLQNPLGIMVLKALAGVHMDQGKIDQADADYRRAITIAEARKPLDVTETQGLLGKYAKFLRKMGRADEAAAVEERAKKLG